MTRSARSKGAYHHGTNRQVRDYGEAAPMSDAAMRVIEALDRPVYDPIAKDDARIEQARARVTLRKFSWE